VFVVVHFIVAGVATVAGVAAALATKGKKRHIRGGKIFLGSIVAAAVTGIVVDAVRLTTFVPENHQKLPGFGMPSSYPARIAFLYAGFCILYLAYEATNRGVFRPERVPLSALPYLAPIMLLVVGNILLIAHLHPPEPVDRIAVDDLDVHGSRGHERCVASPSSRRRCRRRR
jgi:drug/metabolite transporter (DMT)-like permease